MLQVPEQLEKAMAKSVGYTGDMSGFQSYINSNPEAAKTFEGMLSILDVQNKEMSNKQMASGGVVGMRTGGFAPFGGNRFRNFGAGPLPFPQNGMASTADYVFRDSQGNIIDDPLKADPSMSGASTMIDSTGQTISPGGGSGGIQAGLPGGPTTARNNAAMRAMAARNQQQRGTPSTDGTLSTTTSSQDTDNTTGGFKTLPTVTSPGQNIPQRVMQYDERGRPRGFAAPTIGDVSTRMMTSPGLPAGAEVQVVGIEPTAEQDISIGTGEVTGDISVPTAQAGIATSRPQAESDANIMSAARANPAVQSALNATEAAQTNENDIRADVIAAQQTASSVGNLQAAQGNARLLNNQVQRNVQAGELITGTGVDSAAISKAIAQTQAATATPSVQATVQGQLADLQQQFQGSNPPAWAAGAIRNANAQMAARGLSASSLAGQAIVQAAMEASLPIAQADAQVQAQFEAQNLSNRQQVAMLAAEQRARFLGQEFDQEFQRRVQNAARIADIAGQNFNADQQIQLENSRAIQTMNLNNLSNRQALVVAQASALANLDLSNLNNRQQAAVQNAQSFLQMDMANLSNQQQANMFNAQQRIQSIFTDQSAENASRQFNATSRNQRDQYFASLAQQAAQFNAAQMNAQTRFNAGERNTIERFNAEMNNNRDQFNAQQQSVIAQSNANWRRQIATADTATINRANEINAQALLGISNQAYNNLWNYYGDTMEWAWTSAENERSRVVELARAQLAADADANIQEMKNDYQSSAAFGKIIGTFITGGLGGIF